MIGAVMALAAFPLSVAAQVIKVDEDHLNQISSMEYKQWKFTPKDQYYSWYMVDFGLFKTKMPGEGLHDHGLGGVGIWGDNYVNEDWRMGVKLRTSTQALEKEELEQHKEAQQRWKEMMEHDLLVQADRLTDVSWSMFKDEFETEANRITILQDSIQALSGRKGGDTFGDISRAIRIEMNLIEKNVQEIRDAKIDNARRVKGYQAELDNLIRFRKSAIAWYELLYYSQMD